MTWRKGQGRAVSSVVVCAAVVLMTIVLAAATAHAGDARSEAKALLVEGARLIDQGDYVAALEKFKAANTVFPSPKIYFNMGVAYRGLARDAEALDMFERFLAEAVTATADLRAEADKNVVELRQRVATVEVTSEIPGADIMIDGVGYGRSPLPRPIHVTAGVHQVSVQVPGADTSFVRRIEPRPGEKILVEARFPKPVATAPVAGPEGAATLTPAGLTPAGAPTGSAPAGADISRPSAPASAEPARGSRWWLWTGAAIVIAGGAAAAWFLVPRHENVINGNAAPGVVTVK